MQKIPDAMVLTHDALHRSNQPANLPIAVDEFEAAEALGLSVYFLRKDRRTMRRIPFYRIGDRVLYNLARIREALAAFEEGGGHIRSARRARGAV